MIHAISTAHRQQNDSIAFARLWWQKVMFEWYIRHQIIDALSKMLLFFTILHLLQGLQSFFLFMLLTPLSPFETERTKRLYHTHWRSRVRYPTVKASVRWRWRWQIPAQPAVSGITRSRWKELRRRSVPSEIAVRAGVEVDTAFGSSVGWK